MSEKQETFVLDASSLIAYFNGEEGADMVEKLFERSLSEEIEIYICAVNLGEVYYDCLRAKDAEEAEKLLTKVEMLPVIIYREIDDELLRFAATFKVGEKVSYADSFALGLARLKDGKLVTTDHKEFDPIEKKGEIKFYWIR